MNMLIQLCNIFYNILTLNINNIYGMEASPRSTGLLRESEDAPTQEMVCQWVRTSSGTKTRELTETQQATAKYSYDFCDILSLLKQINHLSHRGFLKILRRVGNTIESVSGTNIALKFYADANKIKESEFNTGKSHDLYQTYNIPGKYRSKSGVIVYFIDEYLKNSHIIKEPDTIYLESDGVIIISKNSDEKTSLTPELRIQLSPQNISTTQKTQYHLKKICQEIAEDLWNTHCPCNTSEITPEYNLVSQLNKKELGICFAKFLPGYEYNINPEIIPMSPKLSEAELRTTINQVINNAILVLNDYNQSITEITNKTATQKIESEKSPMIRFILQNWFENNLHQCSSMLLEAKKTQRTSFITYSSESYMKALLFACMLSGYTFGSALNLILDCIHYFKVASFDTNILDTAKTYLNFAIDIFSSISPLCHYTDSKESDFLSDPLLRAHFIIELRKHPSVNLDIYNNLQVIEQKIKDMNDYQKIMQSIPGLIVDITKKLSLDTFLIFAFYLLINNLPVSQAIYRAIWTLYLPETIEIQVPKTRLDTVCSFNPIVIPKSSEAIPHAMIYGESSLYGSSNNALIAEAYIKSEDNFQSFKISSKTYKGEQVQSIPSNLIKIDICLESAVYFNTKGLAFIVQKMTGAPFISEDKNTLSDMLDEAMFGQESDNMHEIIVNSLKEFFDQVKVLENFRELNHENKTKILKNVYENKSTKHSNKKSTNIFKKLIDKLSEDKKEKFAIINKQYAMEIDEKGKSTYHEITEKGELIQKDGASIQKDFNSLLTAMDLDYMKTQRKLIAKHIKAIKDEKKVKSRASKITNNLTQIFVNTEIGSIDLITSSAFKKLTASDDITASSFECLYDKTGKKYSNTTKLMYKFVDKNDIKSKDFFKRFAMILLLLVFEGAINIETGINYYQKIFGENKYKKSLSFLDNMVSISSDVNSMKLLTEIVTSVITDMFEKLPDTIEPSKGLSVIPSDFKDYLEVIQPLYTSRQSLRLPYESVIKSLIQPPISSSTLYQSLVYDSMIRDSKLQTSQIFEAKNSLSRLLIFTIISGYITDSQLSSATKATDLKYLTELKVKPCKTTKFTKDQINKCHNTINELCEKKEDNLSLKAIEPGIKSQKNIETEKYTGRFKYMFLK